MDVEIQPDGNADDAIDLALARPMPLLAPCLRSAMPLFISRRSRTWIGVSSVPKSS